MALLYDSTVIYDTGKYDYDGNLLVSGGPGFDMLLGIVKDTPSPRFVRKDDDVNRLAHLPPKNSLVD